MQKIRKTCHVIEFITKVSFYKKITITTITRMNKSNVKNAKQQKCLDCIKLKHNKVMLQNITDYFKMIIIIK